MRPIDATATDAFSAKAGEDQNAKCKCCIHKEACLAWIRHGKALYEDFVFSTDDCPYFEVATDNNVPTKWIPVTERLPEECDSIFASCYGTVKWNDAMFRKVSDTVLASVEYEDGKRRVKAIITKDGTWDISKLYRASKVTHWMPLPEPPKGE